MPACATFQEIRTYALLLTNQPKHEDIIPCCDKNRLRDNIASHTTPLRSSTSEFPPASPKMSRTMPASNAPNPLTVNGHRGLSLFCRVSAHPALLFLSPLIACLLTSKWQPSRYDESQGISWQQSWRSSGGIRRTLDPEMGCCAFSLWELMRVVLGWRSKRG